MAANTVWITRHSDKAILSICSDIESKFEARCDSFGISDALSIPRSNEIISKIDSDTSYIIRSFSISHALADFTFYRGKSPDVYGLCDRIVYNISANYATAKESIDFVQYSLEKFGVITQHSFSDILNNNDEASDVFAIHNACLSRLEDVNKRIAEHELKIEQDLRKRHEDLSEQLEREYTARTTDLELRYEKKFKELSEQERIIKERERVLDNSDNTHARRAIRQDLLNEIRNRSTNFNLSPSTRNKRYPIHIACIASSLVAIALWVMNAMMAPDMYAIYEKTKDIFPLASMLAKQIGLTAILASIVFFYIKWMNKWFEEHAREEFKTKQFQLDIDRASWIVETMLEWNASQKTPVPDQLICNLSGNLFSPEKQTEDAIRHPGDILASSLLGTASRIKLNLPHAEIECDGKRMRAQMEGKGKAST
ncbi:MAG TPA: hypothetical protein VE028_01095 [Nitratidesulfovibrio sp.]|nr:hypothetical protein [Nitratidesulfovibrio sp.]